MLWPEYRSLSSKAITPAHVRFFLTDRLLIRQLLQLTGAVGLYIVAITLPLPFARPEALRAYFEPSSLLSAVNAFLTGGALERLSLFSLGLLPMLIFGTSLLTADNGNFQTRTYSRRLLIATSLGAGLITIWASSVAAIPSGAFYIVITMLCLVIGNYILFLLAQYIRERGGPGLLVLNGLLIIVRMTVDLVRQQSPLIFLQVGLAIVFFVCFAWLTQKKIAIPIINIRNEQSRDGSLIIPTSHRVFRLSILLLATFMATLISIVGNFFLGNKWTPFGASAWELGLVMITIVSIGLLARRSSLTIDLISQTDVLRIATRLRAHNWIIPDIKVGPPTAYYLHQRLVMTFDLNLIFVVVWFAVWSCLALTLGALKQVNPLFLGPLGYFLALLLSGELVVRTADACLRYIQRVNLKEFWSAPIALQSTQIEYGAPIDWTSFVDQFVATFAPNDDGTLRRLIDKIKVDNVHDPAETLAVVRNLLSLAGEVSRLPQSTPSKPSAKTISLKVVGSFFGSLIVVVCVAWLVEIVAVQPLSADAKRTIVALLVPLLFVILAHFIALTDDLAYIIRRLYLRVRYGKQAALALLEQADTLSQLTAGAGAAGLSDVPKQPSVSTILFLIPNPEDGVSETRGTQEVRDIINRMSGSRYHEQFNLQPRLATRVSDLQPSLINFQPRFVHFAGHGSPLGGLVLADDTGAAKLVRTAALADLFRIFKNTIHGVILSACYSEEQAKAIAQEIDFVVGMSGKISIEAATLFAVSFYGALGDGETLQRAFEMGRNQIGLNDLSEQEKPILHIRAGTDPTTLCFFK